jgi:hypothetical protein
MVNTTSIIDWELQNFIEDFPFFSDPIFLFNPSRIPSRTELLSRDFSDVRYPLVDQIQEILPDIELRYKAILKIFQETYFEDAVVENEYFNRIWSLGKIIRLIKIFYISDETEKFNIITEYFGIDIDICWEIAYSSFEEMQNEFSSESHWFFLSDNQNEFLNTYIKAEEIKKYFEYAIAFLWIDKYWNVEINTSVLAIIHGNFINNWGTIYIPANYRSTYKELLALIIHEIDGHCRQFTYSGLCMIYWPWVRSNHSEEILEWLAMFLEHSWNTVIFWENSIERSLHNFSLKYSLLSKKITFQNFLQISKAENYFRTFRWFYDLEKFMNTKDFVYLQGLYKIIALKTEFGFGLFDLLYTEGVVNEEFIRKDIHRYSQSKYKNLHMLLEQTSAFYILNVLLYGKK